MDNLQKTIEETQRKLEALNENSEDIYMLIIYLLLILHKAIWESYDEPEDIDKKIFNMIDKVAGIMISDNADIHPVIKELILKMY